MNADNKKLSIIGQIDLTEINANTKRKNQEKRISTDEFDSTDFYCMEYEIELVISHSRPVDYFKKHFFFGKVIHIITQSIEENYSHYFIEIAIYAAKCCRYDISSFVKTFQSYWKKSNYGILTDDNIKLLIELVYIIKDRHISIRIKNEEPPLLSIETTNFNLRLPFDFANKIFPNDFYYSELIYSKRRLDFGCYNKAAKLIFNEFINIYKNHKDIFCDIQPMKTIYFDILKDVEVFHPEEGFYVDSQIIYQKKDKPLTASFLIAVAKAYGMNLLDKNISKVIDKDYIAIFKNLWWKCELYYKHDLENWENERNNKKKKRKRQAYNTISEMLSLFKEVKFLELESDIELNAPEKYFQGKGRPAIKNYYDFINSDIANNDHRLNYLIKEITTLFNKECKGKKDRGNIVGLILEAAKRLDFFKEKPSFEKFKAVFNTNNTSGSIIQIGNSAYCECKKEDRRRDNDYPRIFNKMGTIKESLEKL